MRALEFLPLLGRSRRSGNRLVLYLGSSGGAGLRGRFGTVARRYGRHRTQVGPRLDDTGRRVGDRGGFVVELEEGHEALELLGLIAHGLTGRGGLFD